MNASPVPASRGLDPGTGTANHELRVDPGILDLIPPLAGEERQGLERSIIAEGCRDALKVWDSGEGLILLDGHNRHDICTAHGISYRFDHIECADRDAAIEWVLRWQLERRNLPPLARVELALRLKPLLIERAKENQKAGGARSDGEGGVVRQISDKPLDTKREVARIAGVSHDTVHRAEVVLDRGTGEVIDQVRTGEMSISSGYQRVKNDERTAKREARRTENRGKVAAAADPLSAQGCFSTIVIDPPWDWDGSGDGDPYGRGQPDYATMSIEELRKLPIADVADEDCHLYLWTTNHSWPRAFDLLKEWDFRYVTCVTWCKPSIGMGAYFRGSTEHVLFAVRGSQPLKRKDLGTWFPAKRGPGGHSSKPPEFMELVESCSPGPYLEMFARTERDGWASWGADVGGEAERTE